MSNSQQRLPLVTVLIPSYNSPDLYASLDSVLTQSYEQIELILVDDASLAFSKEEVEVYLRHKAKGNLKNWEILVNDQNQGTVRALNRALSLAKGEILFNLAGDDVFFDSEVLSDWVNEFLVTGAWIITAKRAVYDEKLEKYHRIDPEPKQVAMIKTLESEQLFEKIAPTNFIFGCCTARLAVCFQEYGFFDEHYRLIEDHSMNLRLLRSGAAISFFDRIVIKYRGGGSSSAGRYNADYERDVDLIFENEVLPYTKFPKQALQRHQQWKKDQKLGNKYHQLKTRWSTHRIFSILLWAWYRSHHPLQSLRRAFEKSLMLFATGEKHGSSKNNVPNTKK